MTRIININEKLRKYLIIMNIIASKLFYVLRYLFI